MHQFTVQTTGHAHAVDPSYTIRAEVVRCTCGSDPSVGVILVHDSEDGQASASVLLEPAAALRIANALLESVGIALGSTQAAQDRVVASVGASLDAEIAALLRDGS